MTREKLRLHLSELLKQQNLSIRAFARMHNANFGHVAEFLRGEKPPYPSVLEAFGYRKREDDYVRSRRRS